MDLDEMLALLPDNDAGDIDAADLRAVVTGLYEKRTAALLTGKWEFAPGTVFPAAGQFSLADPDLAQANMLYVWATDADTGRDYAALLSSLEIGSRVRIQGWTDSGDNADFDVRAFPSNSGSGYVNIPVTFAGSSGDPSAWTDAALTFEVQS